MLPSSVQAPSLLSFLSREADHGLERVLVSVHSVRRSLGFCFNELLL